MLADAWAAPGLEIKAIAAYKGPSLPDDEDERMRTVCCAVQNDQDDPVLSSICKLVCSLLRVPTAGEAILLPCPSIKSKHALRVCLTKPIDAHPSLSWHQTETTQNVWLMTFAD